MSPRLRLTHRFLVGTCISLCVSLALAAALGIYFKPTIEHYIQRHRLMSDDPATRQKAQRYFIKRLPDNPDLRDRVHRWLIDADDQRFNRLVHTLQRADVWGPQFTDPWLRRTAQRAADPDPNSRKAIARQLAQLTWITPTLQFDHARPAAILNTFLDDRDPNVRYAALIAAAALDPRHRHPLVDHATRDPDPTVARHAWIITALAGPHRKQIAWPPDITALPPTVAEAALFALATRNGPRLHAQLPLFDFDHPDPTIRNFVPYAWDTWASPLLVFDTRPTPLRIKPKPHFRNDLDLWIEHATEDTDARLLRWRLMLCLPSRHLVADYLDRDMQLDPNVNFRKRLRFERMEFGYLRDPAVRSHTWGVIPNWDPNTTAPFTQLASYEQLATSSAELQLHDDMPDQIRLHAVRASTASTPLDLLPILSSDEPTLRDRAAHVAVERFSPTGCDDLILALLADFSDAPRMAGAILAGLTGTTNPKIRSIIRRRADRDEVWLVQQHNRLAQMMLGEDPGFADTAIDMLTRDVVPRTTLTMALLHVGRLEGLDWLINPLGEPPVKLRLLFDQLRWINVLKRYLPHARDFDVWADPDLQDFQIDVLRDEYLINRAQLTFDPAHHAFTTNRRPVTTP